MRGGCIHWDHDRCDACAQGQMVELLAVQERTNVLGGLTRCVSCGRAGDVWNAWYREPSPGETIAGPPMYVLAQDMVQHAER